jgi:hypothetical protein
MYVIRAFGYRYCEAEDGEQGCFEDLCYVCEDGTVSLSPDQAQKYDTEADAWEHITGLGWDPEDVQSVEGLDLTDGAPNQIVTSPGILGALSEALTPTQDVQSVEEINVVNKEKI